MGTLTSEEAGSCCRIDVRLHGPWVDTTLRCSEQWSATVLVSGIWPTIRKPGIQDHARLIHQRDVPLTALLLLEGRTGLRSMDDFDGRFIQIVIFHVDGDEVQLTWLGENIRDELRCTRRDWGKSRGKVVGIIRCQERRR